MLFILCTVYIRMDKLISSDVCLFFNWIGIMSILLRFSFSFHVDIVHYCCLSSCLLLVKSVFFGYKCMLDFVSCKASNEVYMMCIVLQITTVDEAKKFYPLFGLGANVALIFSRWTVKYFSKLRGWKGIAEMIIDLRYRFNPKYSLTISNVLA